MMSIEAFRASLTDTAPPGELDLPLRALWWSGKGDWTRAHEHAQQDEGDPDCDWVHAYLHRVEGDQANAGYWYRRARRPVSSAALPEEWAEIVAHMLARR